MELKQHGTKMPRDKGFYIHFLMYLDPILGKIIPKITPQNAYEKKQFLVLIQQISR